MIFNKSDSDKKQDVEELPPVDLTRRTYTYQAGASCPFCGSAACDATVAVDMNPPLVDFYTMMDETITDLPCCSACGAKHTKADDRLLKRTEWIGYPLSIFHRLSYQGKVKAWLSTHATVATETPRPPKKWRARMKQHYVAHALKNAGMTAVFFFVARRISENTGSEFWTVAKSAVIIGGAIYVLHALWHVLRFTLQPGGDASASAS
ncbi:MAG: hypothetical protein ACI9TH_001290 [Kiritimatiellia bacterium]|jgi:hypothetical protein